MSFSPVKSDVQIPQLEESTLTFWEAQKIFEKSVQGAHRKTFSFYDGPPFATGLPHYGHILQGFLKDVIPRYWTMKGYSVSRRFGWDCHGLPVEYEINKAHKIESRKDILKMGVANYNAACRSIVDRYSNEWKKNVRRIGRWVDMEDAYFTMSVDFMQSVWWVFQELYKKGLIYEGYKVVPYSTGISTPLSNFEAGLNYKMVQDPAITITLPLLKDSNTALLAWTTTPWTLPSNLGLAVGRDLDYVQVIEKASGKKYILARALLAASFKNPETDLEIEREMKGSELLGLEYEPLFGFFADRKAQGAFKVIESGHVTVESGTGIVHMAPAFGEDDYFACKAAGIPIVNPIDDDGMFTAEVPPYQGKRVKDADKDIIADLKKAGRLFKQDTLNHSYPYCYRSDTPLIYRAVSSWFVAVEKIKADLLEANSKTNWIPDHLRDGRFGNWLENARDWAISRNRFWGTPLPIWRNPEGEILCVGSRDELQKLSGKTITDLHIDHVDQIEIPSPTGKSPLKRVEGVLDCWFESGSMPYAQWGYPFKNQDAFERGFPADFIGEGLDQTRGWFYTLTVISTALRKQAPFKNVVVTGLVLAEDGRKMSKSLKNYPDPAEILNKYGADALRLYLIDSSVIKGQELKFAENGVRDVVRRILLRWWNSYSFFVSYANVDHFEPKGDAFKSPNILDQWVLSRLHSLIENTEREMQAYRLYNVVPGLLQFVEDLTNTYIRFNRSHFWQEGMPEDKRLAYETLYEVLVTLSKLMAPFAPFMSEEIYRNLSQGLGARAKESVHLESFPEFSSKLVHPELEEAVRAMETLVTLGRNFREKIQVRAKIPLRSIQIIHRDPSVLTHLKRFEQYFMDELNIREVTYLSNEDDFVQVTAKANFPVLGKRFGAKMKAVSAQIQALPLADILKLEAGGEIIIEGLPIVLAEVEIRRAPKAQYPDLMTSSVISALIDKTVTPEQELEGSAREITRKIQATRKSARLILDDRITIEILAPTSWHAAIENHRSMIMADTLALELKLSATPQGSFSETHDIDGESITIALTPKSR
jgi:isoleucyl-tRNA synthetase